MTIVACRFSTRSLKIRLVRCLLGYTYEDAGTPIFFLPLSSEVVPLDPCVRASQSARLGRHDLQVGMWGLRSMSMVVDLRRMSDRLDGGYPRYPAVKHARGSCSLAIALRVCHRDACRER